MMRGIFFTLVFCFFNFASAQVILEKQYEETDNEEVRHYEDVILDCGRDGEAHFTISVPKKIPPEGLTCNLIVGGLTTGRESLRFIPDHGEYALVAYEYSDALKKLKEIDVIWNVYSVRKALLQVSPQLIAIIKYLQKKSWMSKDPIDLMGYSFGGVFIPVTYVNAEKEGISLGKGVMAYTGAGVYCLLKANVSVPNFLKSPVATIGAALFKPMDPLTYAPQMKGDFLIINGIYDDQAPPECAERLQKIVPEPKTIINLETGHMSSENTELTLRLIKISRNWLQEKSLPYTKTHSRFGFSLCRHPDLPPPPTSLLSLTVRLLRWG